MKIIDICITAFYALLLVVGGVVGYLLAGSVPSLVAGALSAAVMAVGSWGIAKKCRYAYWLALITAISLTFFFVLRFVQSGKFIPSGMMAILSTAVALYLAFRTATARFKC